MAIRRDRLTYLPPEFLNCVTFFLDTTSIALLRLTCRTLFKSVSLTKRNEDHSSVPDFDLEAFDTLWRKDRQPQRTPLDGLSTLPSELLMLIISFVDNTTTLLLRQACRRFYHFIPLDNTIISVDFPTYLSAISRDCLSRFLLQEAKGNAPLDKLLCPSCIRFHPRSSFSTAKLSARPSLRRCIGHEHVVRVPDDPDFFFSDLQHIANVMWPSAWGRAIEIVPMQASTYDIYHQQKRDSTRNYCNPHTAGFHVDSRDKGGAASFSYYLTLLRIGDPEERPLDLSIDEVRERLLAICNDGDTSTASYICPHMPLNHRWGRRNSRHEEYFSL